MSRFSDAYGSKWFSSSDLNGQPTTLKIVGVRWERVGQPPVDKLVLAFEGRAKHLILNKSNATALADEWGELENEWLGHTVLATVTQTSFGPGVQLEPTEAPADVPF